MTTRVAILDKALECFAERGFTATTVEEIRDRSGASIGSIYHHFGGKEQIADALYAEGLADYQAGLRAQLQPDAEASVRGIVRHHLRWVSRNRDLAGFLMQHRESADVRELNRETFAAVISWYDGVERVRPLPLDLLHATILGPAQEFSRHWLAGATTTSMTRAQAALADAAWAAVKETP